MAEPAAAATAPHTKQYVFVDEYNRHKRLKVMRACDGCRKRKIRCDGALQNGPWPCGACVRLKLKCVPPTLDPEDDPVSQATEGSAGNTQFTFQNTTFNPSTSKSSQHTSSPAPTDYSWTNSTRSPLSSAPTSAPSLPDSAASSGFLPPKAISPQSLIPGSEYAYSQIPAPAQYQPSQEVPRAVRTHSQATASSDGNPEDVDAAVKNLTNQMGDLRVEINSCSPWIASHNKTVKDSSTPTVDEAEASLPASVMTDTVIRIPVEMMPHDERVMDYFGYYFNHVHPYIPVLNKQAFYAQWQTARETVPALLLEAIFASVARYLDHPIECKRWLALAAKHEESYKDVPRLSTVQALIILLKAREFAPKAGYFYRSWMALKYIITMATDLDMHEHYDKHGAGTPCTLPRGDCFVYTRIWQVLFGHELIIGGPQGRSDLSIEADTVDGNFPYPAPEIDAFEYQSSRRHTLMAQAGHAIKFTNSMMQMGKRKKLATWALDPAMEEHDKDLDAFFDNMPADLQIHYPEDGSPPFLGGDHYLADAHAYFHLVVVMHHRPQLQTKLEMGVATWRRHLDICTDSAIKMCKLQEALLRDFGLHGLNFMLRGINFTVYCVLTCTMLHLVAITCPDPALNSQARRYFTRHMRVLEQCTSSTQPEIQQQINALREAFSRDTSKPFELKHTLGMHSPMMDQHTVASNTIPISQAMQQPVSGQIPPTHGWGLAQNEVSPKTMDPSTGYMQSLGMTAATTSMPSANAAAFNTSSFDIPSSAPYAAQSYGQVSDSAYQQTYPLERVPSNEQQTTPVWDPSGIFAQWNTAFGQQPAPQQPSPPAAQYTQGLSSASMLRQPLPQQTVSPGMQASFYQPPTAATTVRPPQQQTSMPASAYAAPSMQTVTPNMWQDAFTSAYVSGHGHKRQRDSVDVSGVYDPYGMKRRG
ncbi:hypothetical protein Q7P37_011241 [Cladosporium fusiforme]